MTATKNDVQAATTSDIDADWSELPDDQLIAIYRDWNVRYALLALVRRHRAPLLQTCADLVGAGVDAGDLCRAVLAEASLRISELRDVAGFGDWLAELARRRAAATSCA